MASSRTHVDSLVINMNYRRTESKQSHDDRLRLLKQGSIHVNYVIHTAFIVEKKACQTVPCYSPFCQGQEKDKERANHTTKNKGTRRGLQNQQNTYFQYGQCICTCMKKFRHDKINDSFQMATINHADDLRAINQLIHEVIRSAKNCFSIQ